MCITSGVCVGGSYFRIINAAKGFVENDLACRSVFLYYCRISGGLQTGNTAQLMIHLAKGTNDSRN